MNDDILIDDFQSKRVRGKGMALVLLILTTIGSLAKLGIAGLIFYIVSIENSMRYMSQKEKFAYLVVLIVGLCSILNFVGSLAMFRRRQFGIWIYSFSQLVTAASITWAVLAENDKLYTEAQLFLLIVYIVTVLFTVLYWVNRRYWGTRGPNGRAD